MPVSAEAWAVQVTAGSTPSRARLVPAAASARRRGAWASRRDVSPTTFSQSSGRRSVMAGILRTSGPARPGRKTGPLPDGAECGQESRVPKLVVNDRERTWLVDLRPGRVRRRGAVLGLRALDRRAAGIAAPLRGAGDGDGHRIVDLGSTNGTTLDGAPFSDAMVLHDGDRVDAAGCLLVYWSRP